MNRISNIIREFVADPEVSGRYGNWGALNKVQRRMIRRLCDACDVFEETADTAVATVNRQKAEIERLTTLAELGSVRSNDYRAMRDKARNARAEAIKEFAERLCEGRVSNDPVVIAAKCLLKEMTEDVDVKL